MVFHCNWLYVFYCIQTYFFTEPNLILNTEKLGIQDKERETETGRGAG